MPIPRETPPLPRAFSLQMRLQLWLGAFLTVLIGAFGYAVYRLETLGFYHQIDRLLDSRVALVAHDFRESGYALRAPPDADGAPDGSSLSGEGRTPSSSALPRLPGVSPGVGSPPPPDRPPVILSPETLKLFSDDTLDRFAVWDAVWDANGTLLAASPGALPPGGAPDPVFPFPATARDTEFRHLTRGDWRIAFRFTETGDCVLVAHNIRNDLARLAREALFIVAAGIAAVLLGLGGIAMIVRPALRPLRPISATARRIAAGELSARIPETRTPRELAVLSVDLNRTFASLDAAFARQRQFTSDAAHELRTPIAVILSETQLALRRDHTPDEYRDTLRTCEETAQDMRNLTESLLQLARIDARAGESTGHAPLDLRELACKAAETLRPLAETKGTVLELPDTPCPFRGDRSQLLRLILNLAGNAIEYAPPGSRVQIRLRRTPATTALSVADNGPGIAPADLPHIFDRFYRASRSRTRESGHSGIGLALCKAIAEAHGGTLSASATPGGGATFTATFPSV